MSNGAEDTARHLSPEERERYRQRRTTPRELLELDAHLATCPACREELLPADRLRAGVAALRAQLQADREPHRRRWPPWVAPWAAGMAAAALLGTGALTASLWNRVAALQAEQRRLLDADQVLRHERDGLAATARQLEAELARLQEARAAEDGHSAAAKTLRDIAGRITLERDGHVAGLGPLSPPEERRVRTALATGRIEVPAHLGGLLGGPGSLRGPVEGTDLDPLEPLGTVVESDRPTFRWRPLTGARGYVVAVYDSRLDKVAESPTLTTTEWQPALSLRRGLAYSWQITAKGDGHERTAPAPPAPEARFKVLEQEQVGALDRARRRVPRSHLLLGTQYAAAGLLDDAERELRALVSVDPGSRLARELLESLRSVRRPEAAASSRD